MDPTLIILLVAFVAFAVMSFYLGWVYRPNPFDWKAQASFLVTVVMLIPVVAFVLAQQSGAVARLEAYGVRPLPQVRHVVGITAGQGPAPVWVFAGELPDDEAARRAVLGFYDDPDTRQGWEIGGRGATMIVLERGEARLSVSATSAGSIIYVLRP